MERDYIKLIEDGFYNRIDWANTIQSDFDYAKICINNNNYYGYIVKKTDNLIVLLVRKWSKFKVIEFNRNLIDFCKYDMEDNNDKDDKRTFSERDKDDIPF